MSHFFIQVNTDIVTGKKGGTLMIYVLLQLLGESWS